MFEIPKFESNEERQLWIWMKARERLTEPPTELDALKWSIMWHIRGYPIPKAIRDLSPMHIDCLTKYTKPKKNAGQKLLRDTMDRLERKVSEQ